MPDQAASTNPTKVPDDEAVLAWEADNFDLPPVIGAIRTDGLPPTEVHHTPEGGGSAGNHPAAQPPSHPDDSPTVISRMPVRGILPEDARGNSLRGRRLAHFELIAPVGVGGMAAVIKGRDLQLDRTVALKVLPPEMATDPENVRRFHQEARAAAKLDHENIARVFFCGEDQKLHFIAFEFVQGDNLRTILERRGRLPVGEAVNYILQVATGLAHAAGRGVVHRDIKPSNIIITPTGRAKLVDMGLARSLAPQDDRGLTQSGVTLGTFDYISPEQALEPRDADVRSDIYSLGCTFYHMLTGQPPVPEGTAAKKLHCHQHEAPVDPRQFNPDIPDEVAAILARMMAKNPRDRYQRPEHLVQHLLRTAQKLDTSHNRADGVLFVDAPLPAAPARPLLLAALAVAAVIVLVFVVQQSTPNDPGPVPFVKPAARAAVNPPNKETGRQPDKESRRQGERTTPSPPGVPAARSAEDRASFTFDGDVEKLEQFLRVLREEAPGKSRIELTLKAPLAIGSAPPGSNMKFLRGGLELRGKQITIRGVAPETTVWLAYSAGEGEPQQLTALTLEARERVDLENLRFVLYGGNAVERTAVHLKGAQAAHRIENCQFIQVSPSADRPLRSVVLEGTTGTAPTARPTLRLYRCAFVGGDSTVGAPGDPLALQIIKGGRDAVTRRNRAEIEVEQCVFGPHQSCFHLEGAAELAEKDLELLHCSFLLGEGSAAFQLTPRVRCRLGVSYCLFSRPASVVTDKTVLVRQEVGTAAQPDQPDQDLRFVGFDNRYHNLDVYWDGQNTSSDLRDFKLRLGTARGGDTQSRTLDRVWRNVSPLLALGKLQLADAFQPRTDTVELRTVGKHLIGAEWCAGKDYTDGLGEPTDVRPPAVVRSPKIVDPKLRGAESGTFRTLGQALEEVADGDTVLIRHKGVLAITPVTLEKLGKGSVTIKPAPGYRPVLKLETAERETALFRIHDSRITFQDLEFRLDPGQTEFDVQAVAALLGDGSCAFERCVVTLAEPSGGKLAAVLVESGTRRPKEAKVTRTPAIRFENCLVRGNGDLVWCRAGRPFRLTADNTLAVLNGSVLSVEAIRGEEPEGAKTVLEFRHVTARVGGHLLRLRPANKDLKGIVPLSCEPADCLFATLGGKALVYVAGGDADETALRDKLTWKGSKNAYNAPWLVDQQPLLGMMRKPFDREKWKMFTGEMDGKFLESIKFAGGSDMDRPTDARPDQFAVSDTDLKPFGCLVDRLPAPSSRSEE